VKEIDKVIKEVIDKPLVWQANKVSMVIF